MTDGFIQFFAGAATLGMLNGFDRWRASRTEARARAPVERLGANLGPRVQDLGERVAYIEGQLGIRRPKETIDDGESER